MKRLLTILLLLVSLSIGADTNDNYDRHCRADYFATFMGDYQKIRMWEGNYSYVEYDRGGETYGGIARNFNRKWKGWKVLDKWKRTHQVKWNDKIEVMEPLTAQYYFRIWMDEKYYLIKDQFVRCYLFDYRNTGSIAYRHMKRVLEEHKFPVKPGSVLDEEAIQALNTINPIIFVLHLREVRRDYYYGVVERNPEMEIFIKGWIKRANHIAV